MKLDIAEIWGYIVGSVAWLVGWLPCTCEGWTQLFALMIVMVTFIFITLPKAYDFQRRRFKKKYKTKWGDGNVANGKKPDGS